MNGSGTLRVILASVLMVTVSACGERNRESTARDTLVFAYATEPTVLDGARTRDSSSLRVASQVFETLVKFEPGSTALGPGLARSWSVSPDGRTWTFSLQRGVKFHDGTAFNAAAVCANFDRWYNAKGILQSEALAGQWRIYFEGFATKDLPDVPAESLYRSCVAQSDDEVVINLTKPQPRMLAAVSSWGLGIASPDALTRYGADSWSGTPPRFDGTFGTEHPIGTGPYRFESWQRNDRLVLVRNPDYWGQRPALERLVFRAIPDGAARRQALESGEIDGYEPLDAADAEPLRRAGHQVLARDPMNVGFVGFNQAIPPLDNPKVRQAIAHALNRDAVLRAKYPPDTLPAIAFTPPSVPGYTDDVARYGYDPDRARRLLAESGVREPTLEFWYPTGVTLPTLLDPSGEFQAFSADLERVGFKVVGKPTPWQPDYVRGVLTGEAPVYFSSRFSDPDPEGFLGQFSARIPSFGFEDQGLFSLLTTARYEPEPTRRTDLYRQANRRLMELVPGVPTVHARPQLVVSRHVRNYRPHPVGPVEGLSTVALSSPG